MFVESSNGHNSYQFKIMSFDSYDFLFFLFFLFFFFFFLFSLFFLLFFYAFYIAFVNLFFKKIIYIHISKIFLQFLLGKVTYFMVFHPLHERDLTLHHHQIEWSTSSLNFM